MLLQGNFAKKAAAGRGHIYFIRTRDENGEDVHYALQVVPAKEPMFRRAMRGGGMVDYTAYGAMLASGFTHVPTADTIAMLKRDYDYTIPE